MRSKVVKTVALALVLGGVGMALAQQPADPFKVSPTPLAKPKGKASEGKSKVEELLAEALKNNADIRVAAAKLAEADAELNRTRLQVTQQIVMLYQAILSQKAVLDLEQKKYERMTKLAATNAVESSLVDEALAKFTIAKAKLAELEAQMPGLLGKGQKAEPRWRVESNRGDTGTLVLEVESGGFGVLFPKANIPQAEKIRKALQTPITVDYKEVPFQAILKDLEKKAPGLTFKNYYTVLSGVRISLSFEKPLPVAVVLEALEDHFRASEGKIKDEALCFVVRQYGILITTHAGMPPSALTVPEFLRQKPPEK